MKTWIECAQDEAGEYYREDDHDNHDLYENDPFAEDRDEERRQEAKDDDRVKWAQMQEAGDTGLPGEGE